MIAFATLSRSRVLFLCGVAWCVGAVFVASGAHAASFDCGKAGVAAEKMVCASPELSAQDERLHSAYAAALKKTRRPETLKKEQLQWLAQTRNTCTTAECLKQAYDYREKKLVTASAPEIQKGGVFEGEWKQCETWKGKKICSSFFLLQQGKNICGAWDYWATNRVYEGNLQAVVISPNNAEIKKICGTPGGTTSINCKDENYPEGGWEAPTGEKFISLCKNNLLNSSSIVQACSKKDISSAYKFIKIQDSSRSKFEKNPWVKKCLFETIE